MQTVKFKKRILDKAFFATLTFVETWKRKRKTCPNPCNQTWEQNHLTVSPEQPMKQDEDSPPPDCQTDSVTLDEGAAGNEGAAGIDMKLQHGLQYRQLVSRLRNYVLKDRYFTKPDINRDELILALSTNRTTLSEAVRAVTNNTLMGYLNVLRLEEAKRMLDAHPELTIETIAEKCGFNLRTFHRLFNEHYHITPAKYRVIRVIDDINE